MSAFECVTVPEQLKELAIHFDLSHSLGVAPDCCNLPKLLSSNGLGFNLVQWTRTECRRFEHQQQAEESKARHHCFVGVSKTQDCEYYVVSFEQGRALDVKNKEHIQKPRAMVCYLRKTRAA